jgi:hypothetical protein
VKRLLVFLAAAFCGPVMFLIFFGIAHLHWKEQIKDLRHQEEELRILDMEAQAAAQQLVAFRAESRQLDEELRRLREGFFPEVAEPNGEIAWLRTLAAGLGMEIDRPQVLAVRDREFFVEVPVTFWVKGARQEVLALIEAIENGSPLHGVREVGMPWESQGPNRYFLEAVAFSESPPQPQSPSSESTYASVNPWQALTPASPPPPSRHLVAARLPGAAGSR